MSELLSKALVSLVALAALATSAPHPPNNAIRNGRSWPSHGQQNGVQVGKAVYFLTNDKENAVVALPIGKDGMLSKGTVTKTGGAGSIAINGATGQPGVPDALVGQSALTVVGTVSREIWPRKRIH